MKDTTYKRHKNSYSLLIGLLALLVLLAGGFAAAYFITPGSVLPEMGAGDILVTPGSGGSVSLEWPDAGEGVSYLIFVANGEEKNYTYKGQAEQNNGELTGMNLNEPLHLRIQAVTFARNLLGMTRELVSKDMLEASILPQALPERPRVTGEPREDKTMLLSWSAGTDCDYEVCSISSGRYTSLMTVSGGSATVSFGAEGDMDMPSYDAPAAVAVRPAFHGEGYVLYGDYSMPVTVERESLLGNELSLEYQESGERLYTLRWNETKGDYYEIQEWDEEYSQWETLQRIDRTAELVYETGRLGSGSDHRYRVTAYDREAAESFAVSEDNGFSAEPDEISFRASISPLYATVWPILDLKLYSDTRQSSTLATIPGGTALCVLEEDGNYFYVRYKDNYGYVQSDFCMIDLAGYLGDVCSYNITNSYNSIFRIQDYPIQNVTWKVIQGFEHVKVGEGEYLVPYLYPSAKKLYTAAQAAAADGYRLKIYEAYRPHEATRFLYDTTEAQMEDPVPQTDEEGRYIDPRTGYSQDPETGFLVDPETGELLDPATVPDPVEGGGEPEDGETPEEGGSPEEGGDGDAAPEDGEPLLPDDDEPLLPGEELDLGQQDPTGPTTGVGGSDEGGLEPADEPADPNQEPPVILTMHQAMTDGRYKITAFLAAVTSAHNRGIALDLTLETMEGEEIEMQSPIHDLSYRAVTYLNNDNAKRLEHYMHEIAGMSGLVSEWWHFQDDATRNRIKLNTYLTRGISAEGWTKDDTGWRYRMADGSYYRSTNITVDGKSYSLDGNGYVIE